MNLTKLALRELNGLHVITVEAGTTVCALEFAKLMCLPGHSTACVLQNVAVCHDVPFCHQ